MQRIPRVLLVLALCGALLAGSACKKQDTAERGEGPPPAGDVAPPLPPPAEDVAVPPPPPADAAAPPSAADAAPLPEPDAPAPAAADAAPLPEPDAQEPPPADEVTAAQGGPATAILNTTGDLAVVEAHLCAAVENRECVGEGSIFVPGQMVWALLKVTNATRTERHVRVSYVREGEDPAPGRGIDLRVPGQPRYVTFSKAAKSSPGRYDVVVRDEVEAELARMTFEVR